MSDNGDDRLQMHLEFSVKSKDGQLLLLCNNMLNDDRNIKISQESLQPFLSSLNGNQAKRKELVELVDGLMDYVEGKNKQLSVATTAVAAAVPQKKASGGKSKAAVGSHQGALERKKAAQERSKREKEEKLQLKKKQKVKSKVVIKKKPVVNPRKSKREEEEEEEQDHHPEDEEENDEEEEGSRAGDDVDLIGDLNVASRAPSRNARGHRRVLGKSKRSSVFGDKDEDQKKQSKKKKGDDGDAAAGSASLPSVAGADSLFRAQRKGSRGLKEASRKHAQRSDLMPSKDALKDFERRLASNDPLVPHRGDLSRVYLADWNHWLWYMQLSFNLLFFGVGSKRQLVSDFCSKRLDGEDVLSIDGARQDLMGGSSRTIKALLEAICSVVLKQPLLGAACQSVDSHVSAVVAALDSHYGRVAASSSSSLHAASASASSATTSAAAASALTAGAAQATEGGFSWTSHYDHSALDAGEAPHARGARGAAAGPLAQPTGQGTGEADPSWGGRYAHAQAKLYIVVHSIDGDCLQSPESQRALSRLAQCASVSIVATFDKVNTPLLWSHDELSRFRWVFLHVPTYESHVIRHDFALHSNTKGPTGQGHALEYILSSLANDHRALCAYLAADALSRTARRAAEAEAHAEGGAGAGAGAGTTRGIPFDELFEETKKKLIASSKERLTTLLKELEDHRLLVVQGERRNGQQMVIMQLTQEQLQRIISAGGD